MIKQMAFDVPPDIAAKLLTGELVQYGGVVRQVTGEIYKHMKEIDLPAQDGQQMLRIPHALRNPWVVVPVVVTAATAGGAGAYVAFRRRKERAALLNDYREALRAYLSALQEGRLDAETIDRLSHSLDAVVEEAHRANSAPFDSLESEAHMVAAIVRDSTEQLATHNRLALTPIEPVSDGVAHGAVVELQRRLAVQSSIFAEAA